MGQPTSRGDQRPFSEDSCSVQHVCIKTLFGSNIQSGLRFMVIIKSMVITEVTVKRRACCVQREGSPRNVRDLAGNECGQYGSECKSVGGPCAQKRNLHMDPSLGSGSEGRDTEQET